MPLSEQTIAELAVMYLVAEQQQAPVAPWHERYPELTEDDAYAMQAELLRRKLYAGGQLAGRKAGATNAGAQANFGLSQPVYGSLLEAARLPNGAQVNTGELIHPRLECEVAFVLARDLAGLNVTPAQALEAVGGALAAFELVDARTAGWAAKMPEMIADNVFQARYVLSEQTHPVAQLDLASITAVLRKNGAEVARATGANVLGSPANALAWMAKRMAQHGLGLRAGDVVLAGSLTPLVACAAGDSFEADFGPLGGLQLSFV